MRYLIFASLMFFCTGSGQAQSGNNTKTVIGSVYSRKITELPAYKDYKEEESALLQPTEANYGICLAKKNNNYILLLDTLLKTSNKIRFKILAVVKLGSVLKGQRIVPIACRIRKKANTDIIAIVKESDKEYCDFVIKAWKIDRLKHAIKNISTRNIDCENESYGI